MPTGLSSGEIQLAIGKISWSLGKEVWTGDNEFGVLGVDMVPEATEVDDIIQMRKESL